MKSFEAAVAVGGSGTPYVGTSFFPSIKKYLKTQPNWRHGLSNAFADNTSYEIAMNDVLGLKEDFIEIQEKFNNFKRYSDNDTKEKLQVLDIQPILMRLARKVVKGDSLFPFLSISALLTLTNFALAINATLNMHLQIC